MIQKQLQTAGLDIWVWHPSCPRYRSSFTSQISFKRFQTRTSHRRRCSRYTSKRANCTILATKRDDCGARKRNGYRRRFSPSPQKNRNVCTFCRRRSLWGEYWQNFYALGAFGVASIQRSATDERLRPQTREGGANGFGFRLV